MATPPGITVEGMVPHLLKIDSPGQWTAGIFTGIWELFLPIFRYPEKLVGIHADTQRDIV
jgi:hypothetical protein